MEWNELVKSQRGELKRLMQAEGVKGRYTRITLDLAAAQTNQELHLVGDYIGVASITSTGTCKVRLDHRHSQEIDLREVSEVSSPFGKMYFSTDGAGGEAVVYIGGALTARLKPLQSKVSIRNIAGSDVDLLTEAGFDAKMAALEWSGTPYSTPKTSTNVVQKFEAATKKLRDVVIKNTHASYEVDIGVYHATPATFRAASFELGAGCAVGFKEVDLALLGLLSSTDGEHAVIHVLGVTE